MISICPNCHSHFKVAASLLGEGGRVVRCSICENEWFQEPDIDELSAMQEAEDERRAFDAAEDDGIEGESEVAQSFGSALSGVEQADVRVAVPTYFVEQDQRKRARLNSIAVVAVLFLVTFLYVVMSRERFINAWPESRVLYASVGLGGSVRLDGVVFERLNAELQGRRVTIRGEMINLKTEPASFPLLMAILLDDHGQEIYAFPVDLGKTVLEPEEILAFDVVHNIEVDNVLDQLKTIRVGFTLQNIHTASFVGH